jgi:zinc protease
LTVHRKKVKAAVLLALAAVLSLLTCSRCRAMAAVTRIQLPNQLKLLVFQDHSIPAVTMELLVGAASALDPSGMEGLANLTVRSLSLGTLHLSFDQINDELDFLGVTYGAECTRDFVTIGMQVLKKDLDVGAGLFFEMVEHPSFPAAEVDSEKAQILGRMREDEDNPPRIANRAFDKELFRRGPYAGAVSGDKKSVAAIAPGQVSLFYRSFYRPNNAILVIGGDITPAEVKAKIVPMLLGWQAGPVQEPSFPAPAARGPARVVIDRPVSQAVIITGCSAMARTSVDYYPFLVLNQILGADDLSGQGGRPYTIKSRFSAYKNGGAFRVSLRTENGAARQTAALVREQLENVGRKPVSDAALEAAKKFLVGNFPLRYSLPRDFARFLAESEFYGFGSHYVEKYPALIEAVTASDIRRVAAKYLARPNVLVIVGDLKKINANPPPK